MFLRLRTRQGCLILPLIKHSTGSSSYCNKARKVKVIQIGENEMKLSLFAEVIIMYKIPGHPSTKTKKQLVLHEFSNVVRYKIGVQKSIVCMLTMNLWKPKLNS